MNDTKINRNANGQRISDITGKRLPSKRALQKKIEALKQKLESCEQLLLEHLKVN